MDEVGEQKEEIRLIEIHRDYDDEEDCGNKKKMPEIRLLSNKKSNSIVL